jgi:hypothetical protein
MLFNLFYWRYVNENILFYSSRLRPSSISKNHSVMNNAYPAMSGVINRLVKFCQLIVPWMVSNCASMFWFVLFTSMVFEDLECSKPHTSHSVTFIVFIVYHPILAVRMTERGQQSFRKKFGEISDYDFCRNDCWPLSVILTASIGW